MEAVAVVELAVRGSSCRRGSLSRAGKDVLVVVEDPVV
jgi:hypothetical protein